MVTRGRQLTITPGKLGVKSAFNMSYYCFPEIMSDSLAGSDSESRSKNGVLLVTKSDTPSRRRHWMIFLP